MAQIAQQQREALVQREKQAAQERTELALAHARTERELRAREQEAAETARLAEEERVLAIYEAHEAQQAAEEAEAEANRKGSRRKSRGGFCGSKPKATNRKKQQKAKDQPEVAPPIGGMVAEEGEERRDIEEGS